MDTRPLVYILLGCENSQRRAVLFDLIEGGLNRDESVLYFRPEALADNPFDEKLESLENATRVDWTIGAGKGKHGAINAAPNRIFFRAPGDRHPGDTIEAHI